MPEEGIRLDGMRVSQMTSNRTSFDDEVAKYASKQILAVGGAFHVGNLLDGDGHVPVVDLHVQEDGKGD